MFVNAVGIRQEGTLEETLGPKWLVSQAFKNRKK